MLKFHKVAAQGELTIRRLGPVPSKKHNLIGFTKLPLERGLLIVGHSETQHDHVLRDTSASVFVMDKPPEGMKILRAILENPTSLDHLREHDTHESIMLEPGEYEIRVAREYDPYAELARQSQD